MPVNKRARQPAPQKTRTRVIAGAAAALLAALSLLLAAESRAQIEEETRLSPLTALDRQYMDAQRARINELTLLEYGGRCCRREAELEYLQRLLDDRVVTGQDIEELQAMGILLGDLLASELDLHWIVYEDARGRSRALQYGETQNFLFPVTMIARRRYSGDQTPVSEIYRLALDAMEEVRPPLPFEGPK